MPDTERLDPLEKQLFRLVGADPAYRGVAARILEEGAVPPDLRRPPGPGIATVVTAMLVRAFRPPFKLRDNPLLGPAEEWAIQEESGPAAYSLRARSQRAQRGV